MDRGNLYDRPGWTAHKKLQKFREKKLGSIEYGKGVDGEVLRQYTTVAMYHPEWMDGMSRGKAVKMCRDECMSRKDCGGVQVGLR